MGDEAVAHVNKTWSIEETVVRMLEEYAAINGPKFRMSRYVSNRLKEALMRDLGVMGRPGGGA